MSSKNLKLKVSACGCFKDRYVGTCFKGVDIIVDHWKFVRACYFERLQMLTSACIDRFGDSFISVHNFYICD